MTEWATHFPVKTEAKCGCCHKMWMLSFITSTWTDTSWSEILEETDRQIGRQDRYNCSTGKTFTDNLCQFQLFVIISRAKKFSYTLPTRNSVNWRVLCNKRQNAVSVWPTVQRQHWCFESRLRFQPKLWRRVPGSHTYQHHHYALQQSRNKYWHSGRTTCNKSLSYCQPSRPDDIFGLRDILSSTPDVFTDLLKLVDIVLTLPVTTASNERMFSTLGR